MGREKTSIEKMISFELLYSENILIKLVYGVNISIELFHGKIPHLSSSMEGKTPIGVKKPQLGSSV